MLFRSGVIRDECRKKADNPEKHREIFGSEADDKLTELASAVSFTDARVLAFPVRSLKGVFAWVTCPRAINELFRILKLSDSSIPFPEYNFPEFSTEEAIAPDIENSEVLIDKQNIVLEEYDYKISNHENSEKIKNLTEWIFDKVIAVDMTEKHFINHFIILHDEEFSNLVQHTTDVQARIRLNERKNVVRGALFYEELIPPETIFYSIVNIESTKVGNDPMKPEGVKKYLMQKSPKILQIGSDETTGKGFCSLKYCMEEVQENAAS